MDPALSVYRITVEAADGSATEHRLATSGRLELGDVLDEGREGWSGPRVAIEEIDRHPDALQAGIALAWPISSASRQGPRPVPARSGSNPPP